jgi:hypothetical protein
LNCAKGSRDRARLPSQRWPVFRKLPYNSSNEASMQVQPVLFVLLMPSFGLFWLGSMDYGANHLITTTFVQKLYKIEKKYQIYSLLGKCSFW